MPKHLTQLIKSVIATNLALAVVSQGAVADEEVVVIGTRTEATLAELPSNISVLDEQTLNTTSAVHIQQALSQVPGVTYQRGNGQESLPAIRSAVLTGAGACGNVLVLEEAIPVRGAGFCNVNELFDTHFEQAASLEVVRGANTAFYGSNALTGSINIRLPDTGTNSIALELGANEFRRIKTALSYGQADTQHGRIYLTLSEDGGFRDESGYDQQKFSWRHAANFGQWDVGFGATATQLDQQTAGFIVGRDSYRDPQLRTQNLDPEAFRKTDSLRVWARASKSIGSRTEISFTPYLRVTEMDFLQHFLPGDPLEQNQQRGFGWQSSLTTKVSDQLSWSIGLDAELATGELLQTQDKATRGSPFLQATIPTGTHYNYKVKSNQFGVFGHLNWNLNERWNLIAGARLEKVAYDYDNLTLDGRTRDDGTNCGFGGCRYSRPADSKNNFTHASPKLELQYRPSEAWQWHMAAADAYRAPQATELYRLQREQLLADLDEVRATHVEAGVKWTTHISQLSLSFYQIRQSNVIIRDSDFFNVDGQKIDSTGVELNFKLSLGQGWSTRLVAAYAEHKYASDQQIGGLNINGNLVDTAPKLTANLLFNWQANDKLSGQLEIQHIDDYYLEPQNLFGYPGHTLVNLRGQFQLNEQWSLSLRLLNLGDKLYAERADFTSFTDERYFPGARRSLFAEVRWQF